MITRKLALVAVAVATFASTRSRIALAQDFYPGDLRPTRGIEVPTGAIAGDADATGVELNPAQIGLLVAPSFIFATNSWDPSAARPGRGTGIYLASPVFLRNSLGLGMQWQWPTALRDTHLAPGAFKLTFAWAFG